MVRPTAPCWPATHALLGHLATAGFDGAPRVLGAGPVTETLTYIAGRAAVPPLTDDVLTDEALVSVADLLRRYHRAAASFDPAGYAWPRPVPARYRTGLVSHNDVYPANVVFREGRAVALIDFDLAGPGSADWDFAAAARSFVPLLDEADVTDSRQGRALERFRVFLAASGLSRAARVCRRGGLAGQPRLDLRDRHRGGRRRARRLRRSLARGRPGGRAGPAVVRAPPARPACRRFVATVVLSRTESATRLRRRHSSSPSTSLMFGKLIVPSVSASSSGSSRISGSWHTYCNSRALTSMFSGLTNDGSSENLAGCRQGRPGACSLGWR